MLQPQQKKGEEETDPLPHSLLFAGVHLFQAAQIHVGARRLDGLLDLLRSALSRDIGEASESASSKQLMRKCKALFCIGVNNVTRTLERMPCAFNAFNSLLDVDKQVQDKARSTGRQRVARKTSLQVVIVAIDVHPRVLVSHFPGLAASRKVPLITLSGGNGSGSLRLGQLFNLRTAIAIGLKVGNSELNNAIKCLLKDARGSEIETPSC